MILKFILNLLIKVVSFLFQIVSQVIPDIDFVRYYKGFFELIGDYMQPAVNFVYFIIGEAMFPIISFAIFFLIERYIVFPIVVIIRRFFIKGGDT